MWNVVSAKTNRKPLLRATALAAIALSLVAGCEQAPTRDYAAEGATWKAAIDEAYERNDSLNKYRFEGEIAFARQDGAPANGSDAALLPAIGDGLGWSGVFYREPLRFEADVRLGAEGGALERTVPMLAQDGKLYISVPSVNAPDEYFAVDLAAAETDPEAAPIRSLLDAAGRFDDLARTLVASVEPEWVRAADAVDEEEAPVSPRRFVVDVTEENAEAIASAVREGYSAWAASLPPELAANALGLSDASLRLLPGSTIAITLDEAGYVVDQSVELTIAEEAAPATEAATFAYEVRLTEPNGSPSVTRTVPTNVIPFENVLAFLAAGGARP
jgi:hypothetical protein